MFDLNFFWPTKNNPKKMNVNSNRSPIKSWISSPPEIVNHVTLFEQTLVSGMVAPHIESVNPVYLDFLSIYSWILAWQCVTSR